MHTALLWYSERDIRRARIVIQGRAMVTFVIGVIVHGKYGSRAYYHFYLTYFNIGWNWPRATYRGHSSLIT